MKTNNDMCDKKTRIWTCRIGLLITVCGVLCLMMFQIWTYYFSLVNQMDMITFSSPEIKHIIKWCPESENELIFETWNVDICNVLTHETASCSISDPMENYFIESYDSNVILNETSLYFSFSPDKCNLIKIWQLPWGNNINF